MSRKIEDRGVKTPRKSPDKADINSLAMHEIIKKPRKKRTTIKPKLNEQYKAPGAKPGFLNTMLSTVSRDTLMATNKTCGKDFTREERYGLGLVAGVHLGAIQYRYDPATRKQKPYITR